MRKGTIDKYKMEWRRETLEEKIQKRSRIFYYRILNLIKFVKIKILRFWTFTFFAEVDEKDKGMLWNRFFTALRKYYPNLQYVKVKELHKSGKIHYHAIFSEYVDWHLVQRLWEQAGCGKVVHVKVIPNARVGARYMAKYMSKGVEIGLRNIYTYTKEWCLHTSDLIKWCWKLLGWGGLEEVKKILSLPFWRWVLSFCGEDKERRYWKLRNFVEWCEFC